MSGVRVRLPSRLPAGTKFVVEGEDAAGGGVRIVARYLVYPDGTTVNLLVGAPGRVERCARATRYHRAAQHRESALALQ